MSHEGIRAFDNRSPGEIRRQYEHDLKERAEKVLKESGEYMEFCVTEREYLDRAQAVRDKAEEIRDRDTVAEINKRRGW